MVQNVTPFFATEILHWLYCCLSNVKWNNSKSDYQLCSKCCECKKDLCQNSKISHHA